MRSYARTCQGICHYNLALFDIVFAVSKFSFCGALFNRILAWERGNSKRLFLVWNCSSPFICYVANVGLGKYVFTCVIIKIKIFHSCRTRVVRVALVSHSCGSCSARVSLVFALVSLVFHSCRTRVTRVWHSCFKID